MGALMYADVPNYAAILFRRTHADLALPGALMDRAAEWLHGTAARWDDKTKTWHFPDGATLTFGYMDGPRDKYRYQSAEFQYIGFDEGTQIREEDYLYMFSRRRRLEGSPVPTFVRVASNPGNISHAFFYDRFVAPERDHPDRIFIPSSLEDNPHLDREDYERSLENLDDLTYRQLRMGEWVAHGGEAIFHQEWWQRQNRYTQEEAQPMWNRTVARWVSLDTAETKGETSAFTALGVGDLQPDYRMPLRYVARQRLEFPELVEWTQSEIAPFAKDYKLRGVLIENASSGRQLIQTLRASGPKWLRELIVPVKPLTGNAVLTGKEQNWRAASVWGKRGMVPLPEPHPDAAWLHDFEAEVFSVPNSRFFDQADMFSQLINHVERTHGAFSQRWRARQRVSEGAA